MVVRIEEEEDEKNERKNHSIPASKKKEDVIRLTTTRPRDTLYGSTTFVLYRVP
jgi:hypothetical protein